MPRTTAVIALALLLAVAGCTGGGGGDAGVAEQASMDAEPEATEARNAEGEDAGGGAAADVVRQDRAIIRTGRAELVVDDYDAAAENLTAAVEADGGFVAESERRVRGPEDGRYVVGRLVLRVPAENYSATFDAVRAQGEVRSESSDTRDVTDQLVDIEARLENLRAERDRLRELYNETDDTEDVVVVEERLSEVQGEIERLEAQQRSLQRKVALSTITVELREPRPDVERPAPDRWYDTGVVAAFLDSVAGALVAGRALVVGLAYAAPYLLLFGTPLVGGVYLLRRRGGFRSIRGGDSGGVGDGERIDDGPPAGDADADGDADSEE